MNARIYMFLLLLAASTAPACASPDKCAAGYKNFLGKLSPFVETGGEDELPRLMRRGLGILDACASGDEFAPADNWDNLFTEARQYSLAPPSEESAGRER